MADWMFDPETLVLRYNGYEVDLERMQTSAQVLDWVMQVANKTWCSPECISKLLYLLRYFIDPQEVLCSWGIEKGPVRLQENPSFIRAFAEVGRTLREEYV